MQNIYIITLFILLSKKSLETLPQKNIILYLDDLNHQLPIPTYLKAFEKMGLSPITSKLSSTIIF